MKFELEKFKQSNVARIFLAYAVVAFGMMQIFDYLLPIIEAPLWVAQTLTLLLFLGFPISLLVGWVTQRPIISSETEVADSNSGYAHTLSRQKLVLIGLGSIAIFGFLGFVSLPYLLDQASFRPDLRVDENVVQQPLVRSFRSSMMLGETGVRPLHNTSSDIAISSDGSRLAYTAMEPDGQAIWIKDLTQPNQQRHIGTMNTANGSGLLFFSEDGEWLHFNNSGKLSRVRIEGGSFQSIDAESIVLRSGYTAFDEKIIFSSADDFKLYQTAVSGGEPSLLPSMQNAEGSSRAYTWPRNLPENRYLLVTSSTNETTVGVGDIELHDLESGSIKTLIRSASNATYLRSGHILFIRDSDLWAVRFDLDTLEIFGSQVPIIEGIQTNSSFGHAIYTVSDTGKLLYLPGSDRGATVNQGVISWISKNGDPVELAAESGSYAHIRLSPSEDEIAFTRFGDGNSSDIFVLDLNRKTLGRRTFDGLASRPVWTPDGSQLIYSHSEEGLKAVAADGTEQPTTIFASSSIARPFSVSPEGKLIFDMNIPPQVFVLDLELGAQVGDEVQAERIDLAPVIVPYHNANISPDGNWIAYVSNETGRNQVYVRPFPNINDGKWQASTDASFGPLWNRAGGELFFFDNQDLSQMRVSFELGSFSDNGKPGLINFGSPQQLFIRTTSVTPTTQPVWAYSPDRENFLIIEPEDTNTSDRVLSAQTNLVVVENIYSELATLVPANY